MKKIFTLSAAIISSMNVFSQNWLWAQQSVGSFNEQATSVAVDSSGNIYAVGLFTSDSILFGTITLHITSLTGSSDMFIVKYAPNGNVLWAKQAGGIYIDKASSVAVDPLGNVLVTGYFSDTTIIFGNDTLHNVNYEDMFIVKYDSSGNVQWARQGGGIFHDGALSIATDSASNIIVAGYFETPSITFGSITLSLGVAGEDMFIVKYDSSGNVLWAKQSGSVAANARAVAVDAAGNILVAGGFGSPSISFGSTTLNNSGDGDIFIVKYNPTGNVLWATQAIGDSIDVVTSIAVDAMGDIFLTGYFRSPAITFGSFSLNNTHPNSAEIFTVKYDVSGNVLWAKQAEGNNVDLAYSISADASGNIFVTGSFFSSSVTFDLDTLTNTSTYSDIFIVKYDANGNVLWVKQAGNNLQDYASAVAVDWTGNILIAGSFSSSSLNFGPTTLINTGIYDMFIAKLNDVTGIEEENNFNSDVTLSPNPFHETATLTINTNKIEEGTIEIKNILGATAQPPKHFTGNKIKLQRNNLPSGIYFYTLTTKEGVSLNGKFMVD